MIDQKLSRRGMIAGGMGAAVAGVAAARSARAQAQMPLLIGVLNDLSGIVADLSGIGTVTAATISVEDFGGSVGGRPIELLHADHLNKADVGMAIARQ